MDIGPRPRDCERELLTCFTSRVDRCRPGAPLPHDMIMSESLACIFSGLDVTGEFALYQRHCNDGAAAIANVRHLHMNVDDCIFPLRLDRQLDVCPWATRVDRRNSRCRIISCAPLPEVSSLQHDLRREDEARSPAAHLLILAIGVFCAREPILPSQAIPIVDVECDRNHPGNRRARLVSGGQP